MLTAPSLVPINIYSFGVIICYSLVIGQGEDDAKIISPCFPTSSPGLFPQKMAPPIFWGKSPGDEVACFLEMNIL